MKKIIDIINEDFKLTSKGKITEKITVENKNDLRQRIDDIIAQKKSNNNGSINDRICLDLNSFDVSLIDDFSYLFYHMKTSEADLDLLIKEIDISEWDVSNAKTFEGMFFTLNHVEKIYLPEISSNKLENIAKMFLGCLRLKEIINIETLVTVPVSHCSQVFANCWNLESVDVSNWKMNNCTSTRAMFYGCKKLESIGDITKWNPITIKYISNMFQGCHLLKHVGNLGKWNISPHSIYGLFNECYQLEYVGDISNWDVSKIDNMNDVFNGCSKLHNVGNLTKWNIMLNPNVLVRITTIASMFKDADNLPFTIKNGKIVQV